MTSLLFQRGSLYSSGSTLLLFGYGKILARLARGVKPITHANADYPSADGFAALTTWFTVSEAELLRTGGRAARNVCRRTSALA
jgi:hypothetical protein